ncbi:MAG: septum formation initiator family protein [Bacteroidetes bacterium]|nr:septum formation initiator family protein [Bacteroidota bacterium]
MKKATRFIFNGLKNKYLVSILVFAVVMLFSDHNNLIGQWQRKKELHTLEAKKAYYENEIEKTKATLANLSNNPDAIEKYSREHFYMKKDNEDLFILDNDSGSLKK